MYQGPADTRLGTHPAAGHFTDLESWKASALGTINKVLAKPLQLRVRNVCGGGEQDWACVELMADSVAKNGMDYQQRYSWVMRFDEQGTIVEVRRALRCCRTVDDLANRSRRRRFVHIWTRRWCRKLWMAIRHSFRSCQSTGWSG